MMQKSIIQIGLRFTSRYFGGIVTVKEIYEDENKLVVEICTTSSIWQEDWNLLHTVWGFERGEYQKYEPISFDD